MFWNRKDMYEIFYRDTYDHLKSIDCVRLVKSDKELMKIWRKTEDLWDFTQAVKADEKLKWSEFALYWFGRVRPDWYYRREYCSKFANDFFKTGSDAGALKIGCNGLEVLISNHYGDGVNRVALFDVDHDWAVSHLFPHSDVTVKGQAINVYGDDCGEEITRTLSGTWHVYSDDRFFALVRWA